MEPNQEIVIQFSDDVISTTTANQTIVAITQQLKSIGIDAVEVVVSQKGAVHISYYSTVASHIIKSKISIRSSTIENDIAQTNSTPYFPLEQPFQELTLDVFDIQKDADSKGDLDGQLITFETKINRNTPVDFLCYKAFIQDICVVNIESVSYKSYCDISLAFQQQSYVIPEVRAGPIFGIV